MDVRDEVLNVLMWTLTLSLVIALASLIAWSRAQEVSDTTCRHVLQKEFHLSSGEAQTLIDEERRNE